MRENSDSTVETGTCAWCGWPNTEPEPAPFAVGEEVEHLNTEGILQCTGQVWNEVITHHLMSLVEGAVIICPHCYQTLVRNNTGYWQWKKDT